jgi:hypothetical protein
MSDAGDEPGDEEDGEDLTLLDSKEGGTTDAARLARLARKAESARLARLRHKQFVQDKQAEVTALQREEETLLADEGPAGVVALDSVRQELRSALSSEQLEQLSGWLGETAGGTPLVQMYLDSAKSGEGTSSAPLLPPLPPPPGGPAAPCSAPNATSGSMDSGAAADDGSPVVAATTGVANATAGVPTDGRTAPAVAATSADTHAAAALGGAAGVGGGPKSLGRQQSIGGDVPAGLEGADGQPRDASFIAAAAMAAAAAAAAATAAANSPMLMPSEPPDGIGPSPLGLMPGPSSSVGAASPLSGSSPRVGATASSSVCDAGEDFFCDAIELDAYSDASPPEDAAAAPGEAEAVAIADQARGEKRVAASADGCAANGARGKRRRG